MSNYERKERGESYVLVLYTGGTIGMMRNENNAYVPATNILEKYIRRIPYMHDEEYANTKLNSSDKHKYLVFPETSEKTRILYHIKEYSPLLDSSNMGMDNWIRIGLDIRNAYESYDGFVVLHGTDTLAYTASALSFMFENLGKTVIVTGSQIPVFESRSDGRDNILGSLVLAANFIIPEVTVFFQQKLYRGNRIMKKSTDAFHAFDSPNMVPLAKFGTNIEVDYKSIFRPYTIEKFHVHSSLNSNVGLLRLFPNITMQAVKAYLQPPIEGVVLQTYGAGNIPSNRIDILEELRAAAERDVIIVNCTQCVEGSVVAAYETGMVLAEVGVIPGSDMTPEAALTKLSYVLSKTEWDIDTKRKMMQKNLRGELTSEDKDDGDLEENDILKMENETKIKEMLFPALICDYVIRENVEGLKAMKKINANFSVENADFRTPLHIACCQGNEDIVEYLLLNGASVHAKDRSFSVPCAPFSMLGGPGGTGCDEVCFPVHGGWDSRDVIKFDNTPLMDAIRFDNHQIIKLLVQCGAHLTLYQSTSIGEMLCSATARGDLNRLKSFELAGANLSQPDLSGNTALHLAALHGNENIVTYLISMNVDITARNMMGYTPGDLAEKLNKQNILQLLSK